MYIIYIYVCVCVYIYIIIAVVHYILESALIHTCKPPSHTNTHKHRYHITNILSTGEGHDYNLDKAKSGWGKKKSKK